MSNQPLPRRVFVDTGAFYALPASADKNYQAARLIYVQLAEARSHLFTSNFNLDEAYTLILGRLGYHFAFTFLTQLTSSPTTVIRVTEGDEARAQEILKTYDDKRFSYTDATTFALMDRLNIP